MSHEINIQIFINKQLDVIQTNASSRSKEHKELRDACQELKDMLQGGKFGTPGSHLAIPFTAEVTDALVSVLRSALAQNTPKLSEPALACLHKLVAYAYLQGETRPSGRLDDTTSLVTKVVGITVKAGASTTASVQLSVVKTLLTLATAEHFLCHGDTLMQAVRTVFNIAVGGAAEDIKSTAKSALLQMMNTIVKRVAQQIITPGGTPMISPVQTAFKDEYEEDTGSPPPVAWPGASGAITPEIIKNSGAGGGSSALFTKGQHQQPGSVSPSDLTIALEHQSKLPRIRTNVSHDDLEEVESRAATTAAAEQQKHLEDLRTAQLASLAEQADLRGLEQAMAALPLQAGQVPDRGVTGGSRSQDPFGSFSLGSGNFSIEEGGKGLEGLIGASTSGRNTSVDLPPLSPSAAAAAALRELETITTQEPTSTVSTPPQAQNNFQGGGTGGGGSSSTDKHHQSRSEKLHRVDTPPDPRRALMKERRAAEWRRLTVPERDAIIVINAMCKLAARETGIGAGETYMHVGKLLALDMLVKVLTNPVHDWSQVRKEFSHQLRQPLCLALLRNCMSPYDQAIDASVSILTAIIASPRLREFLKAEVGALYPLLLLRPLEAERPDSPHQVLAALTGLASVCASPQVLVDIFVNYDCNLQAANLFERTIKLLAKYVQLGRTTSGGGGAAAVNPLPAAAVPKARAVALKALLAAVKSMDTWAGPLKEEIKEDTLSSTTTAAGGGAGRPQYATAADAEARPASSSSLSSSPMHQDQLHLHHDVLQKIQTDKAIKSNLEIGIEAFNRNPIKGIKTLKELGVVVGEDNPASAASFLRDHSDRLDPAAVGELLGHHDEYTIAIMHSYIESEKFSGMSVDTALRSLLFSFRLPGEAQKIDRIIEKFAARYCADNPGIFATADAPYLLAFAIIMLNTDAHNPMAEARISIEDFVTMCVYQTEAGEFEEILPAEEVQQLYKRIVAEEIAVRKSSANSGGGGGNGNGNSFNNKKGDLSRRARLAAAVGLTQLAAPFWAGASWDKQHGVDVERQRLLELTGQLLSSSTSSGGGAGGGIGIGINAVPGSGTMWHAATHAEHARPMMQVSGTAIGKALATALAGASNLIEAMAILDGYEQAIRLAALLRLENLCESLVAGLAAAARLGNPAPPHSPEEARQVAALSRLISLGSCSEAGALGSAWVILLRALSELEALKSNLSTGATSAAAGATGGVQPASSAPRPTTSPTVLGSSTMATTTSAVGTTVTTMTVDPSSQSTSSSSSSFLSRLFSKSDTDTNGTTKSTTTVVSERYGRRGPLSIQTGPGMGAVLWAETAGALPIEKIFTESGKLDGEAVLTFFRALAAVSQEELDPGVPGAIPKIYLLQRLVECSIINTERIRLVWQRLWTVVSQHLVSAACHSSTYISMFAVDALRQLADKLLCRAELAGFTAQGDALRPFSAVLRCSDNPSVRELAVACVSHAVGTHARRIGSGWRAVLECLAVAAADPAPAVVAQGLDALSIVFTSLYDDDESGGHTYLRECICAVMAAVANVAPEVQDLVPTALYMVQILARRLAEYQLHSSTNSKLDSSLKVKEAWLAILSPLAAVAREDPRPQEADTAAAVLFQIVQTHTAAIPVEVWEEVFDASIGPMLALPGSISASATGAFEGQGAAVTGTAATTATAAVSPTVTRRASTPAIALSMPLPSPSADRLSPEGMRRVLRHANTHLPDLWTILSSPPPGVIASTTNSNSTNIGAVALLRPSLRLLRTYADSSNENAASLGTRQLHALLQQAGPRLNPSGWKDVEAVVGDMITIPDVNAILNPSLEESRKQNLGLDSQDALQAEAMGIVRRRCRSSLLALRCIGELLQDAPGSMPAEVQLRFLAALEGAVDAATVVNGDVEQRKVLTELMDAEERHYRKKENNSIDSSSTIDSSTGNGNYARGEGQPESGLSASSVGEGQPHQNGAASTTTTRTTPVAALAAAVLAETTDWDDHLRILPSFLLHQVQGGRILLGALRRAVTHPAALGDDPYTLQELKKECEKMLSTLALRTVSNAAAQITAMGATSPTAAAAAGLAFGGPAEDAVRGALVRDALLALNELPVSAWQESRAEVFAQAAKLVCSQDIAVRKAVQALMRSQATAVLQLQK